MQGTPRARLLWRTARGAITLDVPRIMGIVNITPDSFHSGGRHLDAEAAVSHAGLLLEQGADLIDVGGESTRPGADAVSAEAEIARIRPVLRGILQRWPDTIVSVDTVKSAVAEVALGEGAAVVNDVSGLRLDPALAGVAARGGAGLVLMHSRGGVTEMARYDGAVYADDAVAELVAELSAQAEQARAAGVPPEAIVLDPGIGFAKRTEHSVAAIARLPELAALGYPVLLGPSRKRFVGELAGGLPPEDRLEGTIAACVAGLLRGARIFRVHDVQSVHRALVVAHAIRTATE